MNCSFTFVPENQIAPRIFTFEEYSPKTPPHSKKKNSAQNIFNKQSHSPQILHKTQKKYKFHDYKNKDIKKVSSLKNKFPRVKISQPTLNQNATLPPSQQLEKMKISYLLN